MQISLTLIIKVIKYFANFVGIVAWIFGARVIYDSVVQGVGFLQSFLWFFAGLAVIGDGVLIQTVEATSYVSISHLKNYFARVLNAPYGFRGLLYCAATVPPLLLFQYFYVVLPSALVITVGISYIILGQFTMNEIPPSEPERITESTV